MVYYQSINNSHFLLWVMINKRNSSAILKKPINPNPTKWAGGIVIWTEKRTIWLLDNNQINQNKRNLIQYDFPFVSGVSQLWTTEQGYIREQLWDTAVKARIYCIRHGMSVQEKEGKKLQTDNAPLCEEAKEQYKEISKKLIKLWVKKENSYLLYCEWTREQLVARVVESAAILNHDMQMSTINIDGLDTTDKDDDIETRRKLKTAYDTSHFTVELQKAIQWNIHNINIVCVIHKSNIASIEVTLFGQWQHSITLDARDMNPWDIVTYDLDKNWNAINYEDNKSILRINTWNYEEIIWYLRWEKVLQNVLDQFNRWELQIWEVQNYVNAYFQWNPELYTRYLTHNHFRIYCLDYLLRTNNYDNIEDYYLSSYCTTIPFEEKELLLRYTKREKVKLILQKLIIFRRENWSEDDAWMIKSNIWEKEYEIIKWNQKMYDKAIELQELSLDPMVQNKQEGAILERSTYYWVKKDKESSKDEHNQNKREKKREYIDFNRILESWGKYILRAHVGQWKTFWITELTKKAVTLNKEICFYKAKDLWMQLKEKIDAFFSDAQSKWVVLCIDAVDEVKDWMKEYIKEKIDEYRGSCIITARESEYPWENNWYTTLSLEPMDSDKYLVSRFNWDDEKLEKVRAILRKNNLDSEVKSNPLLLTLVTLLAKMKDDEKDEYEKLGIRSLENIKNKANLYESVVRFILTKHAKEGKGQNYDPVSDLNGWMNELWAYAFMFHSWNIKIGKELRYDQNLSILFRNLEVDQYEFIHKSFYEFFLARHLANMPNREWNTKIYEYRDTRTWKRINNWRDFYPTLLFYGEILSNNWELETIIKFLWTEWLLKNDNILKENLFIGLEILYKLPNDTIHQESFQEVLDKCLKILDKWNIKKNWKDLYWLQRFTKNTKYIDNNISLLLIEKLKKIILLKIANKHYSKIEGVLWVLAEIGTPEAIKEINMRIELLLQKNRGYEVWEIYIKLMEIGTPEAIKEVIKWAEILTIAWWFYPARNIYMKFMEIGTPEAIKVVIKWAEILIQNWSPNVAGNIYVNLAKIGTPEAINMALKCADYLIEDKDLIFNWDSAYWIYKNIAKIGTPEAINWVLKYTNIMIINKQFSEACWIYMLLIEKWDSEAIKWATTWAYIMMGYWEHQKAMWIFIALAKIGIPQAAEMSLACSKIIKLK